MLKLVPGTLLATSLGLISISTIIQPVSAFPSLLQSPSPLPSVSPSPSVPTLPLAPVSTPLPSASTALPIFPVSTPLPPASTAATATAIVVANLETVGAKVTESTMSTVGDLAGTSTDSYTGVGLNLPTNSAEVENSVDELIENPLSGNGGASVEIVGNQDSIDTDAGIKLTLQVGDLAVGQICLDGDASIGSAGDKSLADCAPDQPKSVPEPTTTGALVLLGTYFVFRRRRAKASFTS